MSATCTATPMADVLTAFIFVGLPMICFTALRIAHTLKRGERVGE